MIHYADERIVPKSSKSKEELEREIDALERQIYGHPCNHTANPAEHEQFVFSVSSKQLIPKEAI